MGQCYSVSVRFKNEQDKPVFGEAVLNTIIEYTRRGLARFDFGRDWILDGDGVFKPFVPFVYLTAKDALDMGDRWEADFDASYGWEPILYDCLENGLQGLSEGTEASVCVDLDWVWTATVKDGAVVKAINGKEVES